MKAAVRTLWLFVLLTGTALYGAQAQGNYAEEHYDKYEYFIPMRDGVKLYTAVYVPKDDSEAYPFLMKRTPYSCRPYGTDKYPNRVGPSDFLVQDKFIFVHQDVRGRYMSEGQYDNMRPHIPNKKRREIDEQSDTFDTIEWLLKNVDGHNGKVGMWGISYPGHYTIAGGIDAHPALKAISPQAPIADFFFDDFHHNGAYLQSYWLATSVFGYQKDTLVQQPWYPFVNPGTPDGYQFYMDMGPLKNGDEYYGEDNFFWQQLKDHPNYDEFWQSRSVIPHLSDITPAVMTVGGWFDAEDLYGPLTIYKTIEERNPNTYNTIVMGPWSHGDWARERGFQAVSHVYFGDSVSTWYQREVEYNFFTTHLKGYDNPPLPDAFMFDTGLKEWKRYETWPPADQPPVTFYFGSGQQLLSEPAEGAEDLAFEYISDPNKPVPYTEDVKVVFTPRKYMADDQRFAGRRPDVLVFETEPLEDDLTLAGEILAQLKVATTATDADWIVKLIDVYPADHPDYANTPEHIEMGGYQQMVRSEVMRGRFRNDFSNPEPFEPGQVTEVDIQLQDILHTFKKGHRIMIQVQSTWFPLIDRNPQTYVDNIFYADEEDFIKAIHTVYGNSSITIGNFDIPAIPQSSGE